MANKDKDKFAKSNINRRLGCSYCAHYQAGGMCKAIGNVPSLEKCPYAEELLQYKHYADYCENHKVKICGIVFP